MPSDDEHETALRNIPVNLPSDQLFVEGRQAPKVASPSMRWDSFGRGSTRFRPGAPLHVRLVSSRGTRPLSIHVDAY